MVLGLGMGRINNNGWCGHQFRLVDTAFLSFTNSVGRSAQSSTKYIVIEAGIDVVAADRPVKSDHKQNLSSPFLIKSDYKMDRHSDLSVLVARVAFFIRSFRSSSLL